MRVEVSGIVHGRQVRTYDLLVRIALGLGIPPGYMGLAWCTHTDCQLPPLRDGERRTPRPAAPPAGRPVRTG
ncbi:MAG: hypothetical protein HY241_00020 [Actinobacteria bacterium]|nr:hypothetical protein [Actinomycetota bacterium]